MTPIRHALYLHGFASSPASSKAQWFGRQLRARGASCACPDFNEPAFETLTVTRMLRQVAGAIADAPGGPVALIGSSLGAFVALHAAAADRSGLVDRLVLLAPALDFGGNRLKQLGPHGIAEWRREGSLTIEHYAFGGPRQIGFGLYDDAARYDALSLDVPWPTLVVQGRQDELVDAAMVERWATQHPSVTLELVDDGHQLANSLDRIWTACAPFLF